MTENTGIEHKKVKTWKELKNYRWDYISKNKIKADFDFAHIHHQIHSYIRFKMK